MSSGAEYQAAGVAFVAVRMLLQGPLNWVAPDDVPVAVEGEVGGPGDDLRIDFGNRRDPLDVQCKRSLAGQAAVRAAIQDIVTRSASENPKRELVLLVGAGSSVEVRDTFTTDVRNFRQGRTDSLRPITRAVLGIDGAAAILARLYVVTLDVDRDSDSGSQFGIDGLRQVLTQPERAADAWALLVRHALKINQHGRWDRSAVESLLRSHGLITRPVGVDAPFLEQIEFSRRLIKNWRQRTAAGVLDHLAVQAQDKPIGGDTRRQLHGLRGACALALGDTQRARVELTRALEALPVSPEPAVSSDQRKKWCDTRANYALILHIDGDDVGAAQLARGVIEVDHDHVPAWAVLVQSLEGADPDAPPGILDAPEYREAVARVSASKADWQAVIESLWPAVANGYRGPQALISLSLGLLNRSTELSSAAEKRQLIEQAEGLLDEAVRAIENGEVDQLLARSLFLRARAREALGRNAEALIDFERAARLDPQEPNNVLRAAVTRASSGDIAGALSLLTDEIVASAIVLRLLRADIRAQAGDGMGASTDLIAGLDELPTAATRESMDMHLRAAELALDGGHLDLAERALTAVEAGGMGSEGPDTGVLRGRLAVARNDLDAAEVAFRAAAIHAGESGPQIILSELAAALGSAGQLERAISIFEEAGASDSTNPAFRNFIVALMKAGHLHRVERLALEIEANEIQAGRSTSDLPSVLLDATIDIAWRREDFASAARLLDARIEQEIKTGAGSSISVVLAGAMAHVRVGNSGRCADLINEVLSRPDLKPEDRMRAANVLVELGAKQRAIDTAFTAVRARPTDRRMVASFIHVVLMPSLRPAGASTREAGDSPITDEGGMAAASGVPDGDDDKDEDIGSDGRTGVVGPDCCVRVVTADGQRFKYFIYAAPPTDARLGEFLSTDAAVADLIGRRVGDIVVRNPGAWHEQRLTIDRVLPAVVVVLRRYMRTYSVQFPEEPMFRMFNVGDMTPESLGPILAVMHAGADHVKQVLAKYAELPLPLGTVARAISRRVVDVIESLAANPSDRIWVDGPPLASGAASIAAAREGTKIVLTRPALMFVEGLGVWEMLAGRYQLIAPQSMMDEWKQELADIQEMTESGRLIVAEVAGKLAPTMIPVGAAAGIAQASRSLYDRVAAASAILYRPASALSKEDDKRRDMFGAESFDAIALARSENAALYADDLGLRFVASQSYGVESFATVNWLDALRVDGGIPSDVYESHIIRLIEWGHYMVSLRPTTVLAAFTSGSTSVARKVLDRLADPKITAASAAIVSAGGLKLVATARIATDTFQGAADQVCEALIRHREPDDVLPVFASASKDLFALLPNEFGSIVSAMRVAIRRSPPEFRG